jgi:hypothetical protein
LYSILTGYVKFSSTHLDWSDGFRLVRKEKYGNMSDGLSGEYKMLVAVGGLQGREHMWPDALKEYLQVCEVCVCWEAGVLKWR